MTYRFRKHETAIAGLRRILLEELDSARVELIAAAADAEALHEVRKRIKRMRALVRLCRAAMGTDEAATDRMLREVGRLLALHRESDALIEILRSEAHSAGSADLRVLESTVRLHQAARAPIPTREGDLARARRTLGGLRRRLARMEFAELAQEDCIRQLKKSYRRARRLWWEAVSQPTDDQLHEWRKLTKRLLNQLRILRNSGTENLSRYRAALIGIDERLGRARDFAHLAGILRGVPAAEVPLRYGQGFRARLEGMVDDELSRAFAMGRRAFRFRARVFIERVFG